MFNNQNPDDYGLKYVNQEGLGTKCFQFPVEFPPQHQSSQPGMEYLMQPRPIFDNPSYVGSGKLKDKVAIITGGDSGIGRAVAVYFAKEGAKLVLVYYDEKKDAEYTKQYVENLGAEVLLLAGDLKKKEFSQEIVEKTLSQFGHIDILVNNAGVQYPQKSLLNISNEQFDDTMKSNIYSIFYLTKAVLPHLKGGASIINTTSITTFKGERELIDYTGSKGAIVGFTRSLATNLALQNIRVNAVSPGVFWTPLQPASFPAEKMPTLGSDSDMRRAGQPYEIAPIYVYLASDDSTYTTGQVFHINGGEYKG